LTIPLTPPFFDVERKLADMDSAGIDIAILSPALPGPELLGGAQAEEAAREMNDSLAEIVAAHPNRFWEYATLGFGDMDASLKELDRCINTLGFRGLVLYSNIKGKPFLTAARLAD
jgi:predicted TIM-barrel fold metal-dependent hydrolase